MTGASLHEALDRHQVLIYFAAVIGAAAAAMIAPGLRALEPAISPALALMLFATFLQVPLDRLGKAFAQTRFLAALLTANFVVVPVLVAGLFQFLPSEPLLRLGVLLVLLTPCIDYVVTFSHLGRADARALLAATPLLLVVQMLLLPVYLVMLLGADAGKLVHPGPFLRAFLWLIVVPLVLAAALQIWARRHAAGARATSALSLLPVPATALVLFIVVASVVPQLGPARGSALTAIPVYVAFAVLAPMLGWLVGRLFRLPPEGGRAVAFSAATRNSLVVLPLALAVPDAIPVLPAVVVTQTLVELVSELVYVRLLPRLGESASQIERPAAARKP